MLLQFTVENFLSFDKPTTFSMRAGKDKDLPNHLIGDKITAVKGAAIYGANAAGKSNLVLAMEFARDLIIRGRSKGQAIAVRPFELGDKTDYERPCGFHWYFRYEGKLWSYGFDVTARRINEEYLTVVSESGGKDKTWFERKTHKDGTIEIDFDPAFHGPPKSKLGQRLKLIVENLRPEQPFLTHAIENNISELEPAWRWFDEVLQILSAETKFNALLPTSHQEKDFLDFMSDFLRFADTGIHRLVSEREPFILEKFMEDVPPEYREDVAAFLLGIRPNEMAVWTFEYTPVGVWCDENGICSSVKLKAQHRTASGETRNFPLNRESEGTQRLIHLLPALYRLKSEPTVLIIDEIDRRLHSKLTRRFIEMALGEGSLPENQLIFTTHDTNLLSNSLLRRDEIHFARKRNNQTELERLSDYQIRSDRDYERAYEQGRVGGGGPRLSHELYALMEAEESQDAEELAHAAP